MKLDDSITVKLAWLEANTVALTMVIRTGTEDHYKTIEMTPQALRDLADYINDTLCL